MRRDLILALILLVTGFAQAWFLGLRPANLSSRHPNAGLASQYAVALGAGRAALPLSPQESGKFQIFDASYYGGRVYLCFGITPFAVLIVPWYKLTGSILTEAACILLFTQLGYLLYGCALVILFRPDRRPQTDALLAAGFLTVIIGSSTWSLMSRPAIYEIEVAAGYACFAGAVASLAAALRSGARPRWFLGLAALLAGLTMGCRPAYLPAVTVLAAAVGFQAWRGAGSAAARVRALAFCWAPLLVVAAALAFWNYRRFSSIFEFGYGYTAFAERRPELIHFTLGNLPYNLHRYLLGGFRLSPYFPFLDGIRPGPFSLPARTHEGVDQVYGCLLLFPVLAFAGVAAAKRSPLAALLLLAAAGNLVVLAGLGVGTFRYPPDHLGILSFVAAMGIASIPRISSRLGRRAALLLLVPALAWSAACGVCLAASTSRTNLFDVGRPRDFALLGAPFNALAFWLEGRAGRGPTDLRLSLLLPTGKSGRVEPLLVSGDPGRQDFIYLYYGGPNELQVGFESIGNGGPVSAPVKIDYSRPHVVEVALGSFLPPDSHPLLRKLAPADLALARGYLRVEIDREIVLEGPVRPHPTHGRVLVGESPDDAAFGARFTGTVLGIERPRLADVGVLPRWSAGQFGPVTLRLRLRPMPNATQQPVLSAGYRPSGGILFLETLPQDRVRLGWELYGQAPVYSGPFAWDYGQPHELTVFAGFLLPPADASLWVRGSTPESRRSAKRGFVCLLDGQKVWSLDLETPEVAPASVLVGRNGIQQAGVADALNATEVSERRAKW